MIVRPEDPGDARLTAELFVSAIATQLGLERSEDRLEAFVDTLAKILRQRDERISELARRLERPPPRGWSR